MREGAGFFTQCGEISTIRLSALRLAKYSNTPIGYFMEMPIGEFYAWIKVMNAEIERENKEVEAIKKQK
jgi:hypothetical protein